MTLTPAQAGFIKGVIIVAIAAVVSYLANASNLNGVVSPVLATVIAALASSLESYLKKQSGDTIGLFGAVRLR